MLNGLNKMNKIKSIYGIYVAIVVCLVLGQQVLFKTGQTFESLRVNQEIKTKELENSQLKILIAQKEKTLGIQNQEISLENLIENRPLQVIQKNKNENNLELTVTGTYSHLIQWLETLPDNRIGSLKLYEQQRQIWCEIKLKNVS